MLKIWLKRYISSEAMATTLVIWLCSLAVIGLVVAPLFGTQVAVVTALGLLVALLIGCWVICVVRPPGRAH